MEHPAFQRPMTPANRDLLAGVLAGIELLVREYPDLLPHQNVWLFVDEKFVTVDGVDVIDAAMTYLGRLI